MISYNDLYEILRKEKYAEVLQELPKNFLVDFSEYVNDKKEDSGSEEGLFSDNVLKSKKQLENSISMFKELMRLRKKKLLSLVFVAVETGIMKRDYENMLPFERDLFDKLVKSFEDGDKELARMLSGTKAKEKGEALRMIMFNQDVEQFVDMGGNLLGPFAAGELSNIDGKVAEILVSGGKASFVDEE